jgi:hypothetical protein
MAAVTNATSVKIVRFESHFITLDDGPTIELMTLPELPDAPLHPEFIGWAHIAINVGSKAQVTAWPSGQANGTLLSAPRLTGDGFYEAVIADRTATALSLSVHKISVSFLHRPGHVSLPSYGYHIVK